MRLSFRILGLVLGTFASAGVAQAQKIRSADTGAVDLVLKGPDSSYLEPATVAKGDLLWAEEVEPLHVKVLVDDVQKRNRPSAPAVAAGTPLIGVRIASGIAYCPSIAYDAPSSKVQCFQDLDDDGKFDGGYYTDQRGFDTQFLSGWVRGLTGLSPKIAYSDASDDTPAPVGRISVKFDGMRRDVPRFRLYVEEEKADDPIDCQIPEPGVCVLMGRRFSFSESEDGSVLFKPTGLAENRYFSFYSKSSYRQ